MTMAFERLRWVAAFRMKDLLTTEDVEPQVAQRLGQATASRLARSSAFPRDVADDLAARFNSVKIQEDFNEAMIVLYDSGDALRVWIK
jgi:hypothetical protein